MTDWVKILGALALLGTLLSGCKGISDDKPSEAKIQEDLNKMNSTNPIDAAKRSAAGASQGR